PYRDFLVVQWSFHDSSRIFSSPNSAVVGVDRPSGREMSFVGHNKLLNQSSSSAMLFETPTPQMPSDSRNRQVIQFMMPMDFVRIASGGYA
ncbi:hypothetical protein TNCV_1271391, partial [Trichonephila clavipes]